ncbi:MAG: glycoside hydrolase family 88 protein [Aristaeellaceae bacterium]
MSIDIVERFPDKAWLDDVAAKLHTKMTYAVGKAREVDYIPYSTENGQWKPVHIHWWTNGFWPATMWQMYLATKDELYRDEAIRAEKMLDVNLLDFEVLSHDVGFMWLIQSGVRYALEGNRDSYARTMKAAQHLACRYNPNGFIRAWNGEGRQGWAIVDCMMNLPLLYWASEVTGDPRFRLIAMKHADTAMDVFVRPDGSCNHIIIFDAETGEVLDNPGGQGYASGSSWSRGQAWALYGFTLSYLHTGKQEYLDTAKRVANYFISQITDDYIPRCDFRQPAEPVLKDDTAGTVAAAGLLVLAQQLPELEAVTYYDVAVKMLRAMEKEDINWELNDPALLQRCTSAYHDIPGRHMTMNYADYYFVEAINMLRGQKMLFWYPNK